MVQPSERYKPHATSTTYERKTQKTITFISSKSNENDLFYKLGVILSKFYLIAIVLIYKKYMPLKTINKGGGEQNKVLSNL